MDVSFHDVLLVGGGGAGLRAAIAVAEFNPKLSVAVVSKVYPMRSHTVSAEGGAAGVIADDDSLDEHAYDTVSGSDWLSDQDLEREFERQFADMENQIMLTMWGITILSIGLCVLGVFLWRRSRRRQEVQAEPAGS